MKAVFLDYATVSCGDLDDTVLKTVLPDIDLYPVTREAELPERVKDAEILLTNKIAIDAMVIRGAPDLKLICLAATGTNNVDLDAASERGIRVCNIRAYCTASVTQHVFAMILSLSQHLASYQKLLNEDSWRDSPQFCLLDFPVYELAGKTIGIVGYGELGRSVARVAEVFGMEVLLASRAGVPLQAGRLSLDELLHRVDVVSLHCPLTPNTQSMIGARELSLMKKTAIIINTARGALIDEHALLAALQDGVIGGAGIDVLSQEPPVDGNPLLEAALDNLIVTPHIAWAAHEARQRALDEMTRNIRSFLDGGDRGVVKLG